MNLRTFITTLGLITMLGACATPSPPLATDLGASASARLHNEEGMTHYQLDHWEVAKEHFAAAIEAEPKLAQPHYNLALVLHQLGTHTEATSHLKQAAELAPRNTAITGSSIYWSHVDSPRISRSGYYGRWSRHHRLWHRHRKPC